MLEKRDTKDSLVPILLQALDLLIQSTPEAKEHYLDSQGEEVLERWNDHKNEQVNLAKRNFDKSMQGTGICEEFDDQIFQQLYGCYIGTHGTGTTEQVGRSDDDRYFDDEAYEKEELQLE